MPKQSSATATAHPRWKLWLWFVIMGPLQVYGRVSGRYRPIKPLPQYPVVNSPARNGPILAFGDSLTAGYGAAADEGYPAQLSRILGRDVVNLGVNGDTSQHGLERLEPDVLSRDPAVVLVGFGGNDLIQRRRLDDCFACLEQIVRRIQATGALVVLIGIRGSWLYNIDYETPYRELAIRTGCPLVPSVLDGIWGVPWLMRDVAHPNARGYAVIARRVAEALRPHLQTGMGT